jgi:phosphoglycerate kinase
MNTTWNTHLVPEDMSAWKGKRVLVRVDWNLPVVDNAPTDTTRFDVTTAFLQKLSFAGAKVIIMSHFGEKGESIAPVAVHAKKHLSFLTYDNSLDLTHLKEASNTLLAGDMLLIENVRLFEGETDNNPELGESLAALGDIFINDAFSVSHRKHASVVGIPTHLESYIGPTCAHELENLTMALTPEKPALLIVGGAKIATKLDLIRHYLDLGVHVFVGGAMVHNIWRSRGIEIGTSLQDPNYDLPMSVYNHPMLLTPVDVVLDDKSTVSYLAIPKDRAVYDCGPETVKLVEETLKTTKTAIINGPLGLYEKGFTEGSEGILKAVIASGVTSYAGGGDTVTVANALKIMDKFTFMSLGGGAMLDFLSSGTLPGIDAVTK